MNLDNLEKVLNPPSAQVGGGGEPKYRLKQANEAVFKNFISDWSEATIFPKNLRDKLNKECPLEIKADLLISKKPASAKGFGEARSEREAEVMENKEEKYLLEIRSKVQVKSQN